MPIPNLSPEWRWRVYIDADQRKVDAFVVADAMADLISGKPASWGGVFIKGSTGGGSGDWKRIGADLTISNAGFARFLPDGTVERFPQAPDSKAFGGFYILPTVRPQSSIVDGVGTPVAGKPAFRWTTTEGEWETSPALAGRGTGLLSRSTGKASIQANTALGNNQGFEVGLDFLSYGNESGECLLRYGPDVRLAIRQGHPPVVERLVSKTMGNQQSDEWTTWERLEATETFNPRGTRHRFQVSQIGGRKVVEWNDQALWFLEENEDQNQANIVGQRARAGVAQWGGVPIRLETTGCRVRAEIAVLDHLNDAGTAPRTATIVRKVPLASAGSYQPRLITPMATGFVPNKGAMDVSLSHDEDSLTYTVTLSPDPQGMQSPCTAQVLFTYTPVWVTSSGNNFDFSKAVTNGRINLSAPPAQAGSEGSVTVDLKLAAKLCPAAIPYLKDFAPFDVSARWRNDTTGQPYTDYRGLMQGYLFGTNGKQPGYNTASLDLTLRDPSVRLHDEAGLIDGNFQDLIVEYNRLSQERIGKALKDLQDSRDPDAYVNPFTPDTFIPATVGDFYGGDAVKYVLSVLLGPVWSNKLNGNGNARRFLPANHPALISGSDVRGSIAPLALALGQTLGIGSLGGQDKNGFFPPPYGKDGLGYATDIGKSDAGCVFFFGAINRDTNEMVPIYGQYETYLDSAKGWRLDTKDAANIAGMIEAASAQTRPESAINRVLVWANPFGAEIPFSPAFVQGEARIASGPNAPQNSWARTMVFKEDYAQWITTPDQAAAVAATILLDVANATPYRPRYETRGDARWLVGDVFFAQGLSLNINDLYVRAQKIEHSYDVDANGGRWWTTALSLIPMTSRQQSRFIRNHSLEGTYVTA